MEVRSDAPGDQPSNGGSIVSTGGAVRYYISFILPPILVVTAISGGNWPYVNLVILFAAIPVLDLLIGRDDRQPPLGQRARFCAFDLPLLLWVPVQVGLTAWTVYWLSTQDLSTATWVGIAINLGLVNGIAGINVAHELCHRSGRLERAAAEVLLTTVSYSHFAVEHVHGHHRYVATPRDPASSRYGESFYAFWPRTVICSYLSFLRIERAIVEKRGVTPGSWHDRRARYTAVLALIYIGLGVTLGPTAVFAFAVQSVVAFTTLEVINYIEHYGLTRREIREGRFERVQPRHSWNTSFALTNWFLFNLQRHSDHHYSASRTYDRLRHHPDAPQLPAGYATMLVLALIPPAWFLVMNPRVRAWHAQYPAPDIIRETDTKVP